MNVSKEFIKKSTTKFKKILKESKIEIPHSQVLDILSQYHYGMSWFSVNKNSIEDKTTSSSIDNLKKLYKEYLDNLENKEYKFKIYNLTFSHKWISKRFRRNNMPKELSYDFFVGSILYRLSCEGRLPEVNTIIKENNLSIKEISRSCAGACQLEHWDIAKFLLSKGANANTSSNAIIRNISRKGNLELLKYAVEECCANVRFNEPQGSQPDYLFAMSCWDNHFPIVKYYVEECKIFPTMWGLELAFESDNKEIIEYLQNRIKKRKDR